MSYFSDVNFQDHLVEHKQHRLIIQALQHNDDYDYVIIEACQALQVIITYGKWRTISDTLGIITDGKWRTGYSIRMHWQN